MSHKDVFISYKSEDFDQAQWLRTVLETNGVSCWMAPASIPGGSNYAREIPRAIDQCRVFVVVLTGRCQSSIWVPKELDRALNSGKVIMPFMLENCALTDDFNFYLSNVQRYAAYQDKMAAAQKLLQDIRALLQIRQTPVRMVPPVKKPQKIFPKPGKKLFAVIGAVLALVILASVILPGLGMTTVDAFQDLEVTVEGAAPYAVISLTNHSPEPFLQSISYSATPDSNLDLGDKVTITANISREDAKAQGYKLASHKMEFTVEDIPSCLQNPSLLTAADVAALQEKMEQFIRGQGREYPVIHCDDGSETDIGAENLAGCMTAFSLQEKAYVCTETLLFEMQESLILPFCMSLEDVPYTWLDNVYHEEPVLVDYPALYGYFSFTNLMLDENGNLIREGSFGIEMSDLYESSDVMNMEISRRCSGGEMVSGMLQSE